MWRHCCFLLGLSAGEILFAPFKDGVCFSQSCGSPVIRSCWPSKSDSLGIPSPFVGSPVWEACYGAQNLHNSGRTSAVQLFLSLCVAHLAGVEVEFTVIAPLLLSGCGFSFVSGRGVYFLVGSSIAPSVVIQQLAGILVSLRRR